MRFKKVKVPYQERPVVRGIISLTKECWLKVSAINLSLDEVYNLADSPINNAALNCATDKGRKLTMAPVKVTLISSARGIWDEPEYWFTEPKWVNIRQGEETLYDGPIVRGCSGDVFNKTGLFTSMNFFERYFREELKKEVQTEVEAWIMES